MLGKVCLIVNKNILRVWERMDKIGLLSVIRSLLDHPLADFPEVKVVFPFSSEILGELAQNSKMRFAQDGQVFSREFVFFTVIHR
ncbi:hypothetical protein D9M69_477930 [compost metagenome]